jgi:hydroxylaminobenzene mutase
MTTANRFLVRAGFLLFLFALLTGLAIPVFLNQKMALAAHVTGVVNGLLLVGLGLAWSLLSLTPTQGKLTTGLFLYGAYANWGATCLAAAWGTSRLTPLSGAGHSAEAWQETLVQVIQVTLALAIIAGALLVVYALRSPSSKTSSSTPSP